MQRREPAHFGAPARAVSDFLEDELHAGRLWRFFAQPDQLVASGAGPLSQVLFESAQPGCLSGPSRL